MRNQVSQKAIWKAAEASNLLAKAARLMREAAGLSADCGASGRYDFLHWAHAIEELISCDGGEAGIEPTLDKWTVEGR